MTAATTTVPFPALGLPTSDGLGRASNLVDELTKRHEVLRGAKDPFVAGVRRHGNTFVQSSCTATTAATLGAVNGRFGGDKGVLQKWGISLDAAVALVGHAGGFALSLADSSADPNLDVLAGVLHTVGDTGLASGVYRFFHERGSAARRAAAGSPRARS
jgi:hypothetical protein